MKRFTKKDHPQFDPKRRKWQRKCNQCGYPAAHRIYVCAKCGNCQSCGGFNPKAADLPSCVWCGNGFGLDRPEIPELRHEHVRHDLPAPLQQHQAVPVRHDTPKLKTARRADGFNIHNSNPN